MGTKDRFLMVRAVAAVVFFLVLLGLGIWLDVGWLLVGGIEEVVRGAQASPVSAHDVVIGAVRVFFCGVGLFVGFLVGTIGASLLLGDN